MAKMFKKRTNHRYEQQQGVVSYVLPGAFMDFTTIKLKKNVTANVG